MFIGLACLEIDNEKTITMQWINIRNDITGCQIVTFVQSNLEIAIGIEGLQQKK